MKEDKKNRRRRGNFLVLLETTKPRESFTKTLLNKSVLVRIVKEEARKS